jgi:hypothetical protein
MATPALMSEDIILALETDIQNRFRDCLDLVELRWSAKGYPMTLESPKTVTRGFTEGLVKLDQNDFPRIAILGAPVAPSNPSDQGRTVDAIHTILIEWNVLGADIATASTLSWRYSEALVTLIQSASAYERFAIQTIVPQISEGQAIPHVGPVGVRQPTNKWICGGIATWPFKGRYSR